MKVFPIALALSLAANAALVAVLSVRSADTAASSDSVRATATAATGATVGVEKEMSAGATATKGAKTWGRLHTDDLSALVTRLRAAGFPPDVIRRVIVALITERLDARRLEIEKANLEAPFWASSTTANNDPKIGPELRKLQREQIDLMKQLLGGNLADLFAGTEEEKAMLRQQIGNIAPEKLEPLYAVAMDYSEKMQQVYAALNNSSGRSVLLDSDREKISAIDKAFRADLGKFLTPAEVTDFTMRSSQLGSQLRSQLAPFRATEDEFRTIFTTYQSFQDQYPTLAAGYVSPDAPPATRLAMEQLNSQISASLGPDRAADFQQAINPTYYQLNRLVARLDLPLSAAAQVAAVQQDVIQRANGIATDPSLSGAARMAQLGGLAQEASAKISTALGGQRGLDAYKEYGGQWLSSFTPRPRPAPSTPKG